MPHHFREDARYCVCVCVCVCACVRVVLRTCPILALEVRWVNPAVHWRHELFQPKVQVASGVTAILIGQSLNILRRVPDHGKIRELSEPAFEGRWAWWRVQ